MYNAPFIIDTSVSNNAFSFSERKHSRLHVPALIQGGINDLRQGDEIVFEDFENERLKSCTGLKNFIRLSHGPGQTPVYFFDNHNHAFYFWHYERNQGTIRSPIPLIHVDQHKDTRIPTEFLTEQDSHNNQKLFDYTNKVLNVGNFIPPAIKTGLISEVFNIDSEDSLNINPPKTYILDIDLDFFAPELDYIPRDKKMNTVKKLIPNAAVVTVATSPFFIDQELAISLAGELFS